MALIYNTVLSKPLGHAASKTSQRVAVWTHVDYPGEVPGHCIEVSVIGHHHPSLLAGAIPRSAKYWRDRSWKGSKQSCDRQGPNSYAI